MRNWKVKRTISSALFAATSNFARIVRDLYSSTAELKILASSNPLSTTNEWTSPYLHMMRQFLTKKSEPSSLSKNKPSSNPTSTLAASLTKAFQLLSENYDNTKQKHNPRLIVAVFDPSSDFDDSWTYVDSDGTSISIYDFTDNLIIDYNGKLGTTDQHKLIKGLDLSLLVFVAESPTKLENPLSDAPTSKKRAASESPSVSDSEEEDLKKSKLLDTAPSSNSAISRSTFSYSNDQFCFCNGKPLPTSKAQSGFKFLYPVMSFVRPSYASQAISNLACALYRLNEVQIYGIPTRNPLSGEQIVLPSAACLLAPMVSQSPFSKYLSQNSSYPYIGHHLGAGTWMTPIKLSVQRWPLYDPPIGFPSQSAVKVTSKSTRNVSSGSILASVTDRRPLLLKPILDGQSSSHLCALICEGTYVYLYNFEDCAMDAELGNSLPNLNRAELLSRSSRLKSMCGLMIANTFSWTTFHTGTDSDMARRKDQTSKTSKISKTSTVELDIGWKDKSIDSPKQRKSSSTAARIVGKYMTTKGLELATRIFPLTDESSILYAPGLPDCLSKHINPIVAAISSTDIPIAFHAALLEHVKSLATLAAHNDVTSFPYTKTAVAKRRELYTQLWTELLTLIASFSDVSAHHKLFMDLVRHAAPDPELAASILPSVPDTPINNFTTSNYTLTRAEGQLIEASSSMDVDLAASSKAAEQQWMKDVESVRHDIVGLKDASWAPGARMHVPEVPLPLAEFPSESLYTRYWNAAKERKELGTHLKRT